MSAGASSGRLVANERAAKQRVVTENAAAEEWSLGQRLAAAAALGSFGGGLYYAAGEPIRVAQPAILTRIDQAVPFIPESVWFYEPPYFLGFLLTAWAVRERKAFLATMATVLLVVTIATSLFLLFPFAAPRPDVPGGSGWTRDFVAWVYAHDPIYNTFPSLHVTLSVLNAAVVSRFRRGLGVAMGVAAAVICVSVLTLKQHWSVDVAGGLALAAFGFAMWNLLMRAPGLVPWPAQRRSG